MNEGAVKTLDARAIIGNELALQDINEVRIAKMREEFMPLVITDMNNEEQYKQVHKALMVVKKSRVAIVHVSKKTRDSALQFQRDCIAEEKRLIALIEPIESHLEDEQSRVDEEKARIKREAAEKEAKILQERVNALFALGCRYNGTIFSYGDIQVLHDVVKAATDEQFCGLIQAITDAVEKDQAAKAAEEAARKAEAERLAKVAAEQEAERKRLAAEAKKIQDEKDRLEREKREAEDAVKREEERKLREAELEKAKAEAAERARIETEERLKREAQEREEREKREAEEKARKEAAAKLKAEKKAARLPDKMKLSQGTDHYFSLPLLTGELRTEEGLKAWEQIQGILGEAEKRIRDIIEAL